MEVPCGQCLGCRLDRSREWAARIVHESTLHEANCFITLTYREPQECTLQQIKEKWHLPDDGSLHKSHYQKFMKRLRKHFKHRTIRYYHCGEYGDELQRPHYHACLFNCEFVDQQLFKNNNGYPLFTSQLLEKLWPYGYSTIGNLTFETAAYTARYCLKKITGEQAHEHYLRWDENGEAYWLQPEYNTMSRRPGIGKDWYDKYKDDVFPSDEIPVPGHGIDKKVPRYYQQLFKESDPETLDKIKLVRQKFKAAHRADYTPQRLYERYKVKKAQLALGNRGKEI